LKHERGDEVALSELGCREKRSDPREGPRDRLIGPQKEGPTIRGKGGINQKKKELRNRSGVGRKKRSKN